MRLTGKPLALGWDVGVCFHVSGGPKLCRSGTGRIYRPGRGGISPGLPAKELLLGFPDLVPDLVVEVVSPNYTAGTVQGKLEDWLGAGASLVWIVYPYTRSVAVYLSLDQGSIVTHGDKLEGGLVLPGFSCPVSELF